MSRVKRAATKTRRPAMRVACVPMVTRHPLVAPPPVTTAALVSTFE